MNPRLLIEIGGIERKGRLTICTQTPQLSGCSTQVYLASENTPNMKTYNAKRKT